MAMRTDKAVEIFSALNLGKIKNTEIEVAEAREALRELAKNPSPNNRWEIAQIIAYTVEDIMNERVNYLDLFADVKNVGIGEKAAFDIELDGIQAFVQAKGATTQRSKVFSKSVTLDTEAVSARPYVNFVELASGKVNFDRVIEDAAYKMEMAMLEKIQNVLYAGFSGYSAPNYGAGSGVVKATLDSQIYAFSRFGNVSLVGDLEVVAKLAGQTGFQAATGTQQFSTNIIDEQNMNGYIGKYIGANVVKMNNPFKNGSLTETILNKGLLYIVPAGRPEMRPLKVVMEGEIQPIEATNIDDRSFEIRLDKHFGAGLIFGSRAYMGVYEDTSL